VVAGGSFLEGKSFTLDVPSNLPVDRRGVAWKKKKKWKGKTASCRGEKGVILGIKIKAKWGERKIGLRKRRR